MFVKRETTSSEIKTSDVPTVLPHRVLYNSKLLLTLLLIAGILLERILCMNVAIEYNAVLTEETIILNGSFYEFWEGRKLFREERITGS